VEAVQKYSLDAQLSTADSAAIILDVRKDLQSAIVSVIGGGLGGWGWGGSSVIRALELKQEAVDSIRTFLLFQLAY
jgi:rhodanese-related sulfurtransferase